MRKVSTIWTLRAVFFVLAGAFRVYGVLSNEHYEVLMKAIMICLECIGIG